MKRMKKWTIGIVVAIIVIVAIVILAGGQAKESQTEFGAWSQEILVEYSDGTIESLHSFLSIHYNNKDVSAFIYKLNAKNTATEIVTLNLDDYSILFSLNGPGTNSYLQNLSGTYEITPDSMWKEICTFRLSSSLIEGTLPDGAYTLTVTPIGTVTYSFPGGLPQSLTLPIGFSKDVTITIPPFEDFSNTNIYNIIGSAQYIQVTNGGYSLEATSMPDSVSVGLRRAIAIPSDFILKYSYILTELTRPVPPEINGGRIGMALSSYSLADSLADFGNTSAGTQDFRQTLQIYTRCYVAANSSNFRNITCFRDMRSAWSDPTGHKCWDGYEKLNTQYDIIVTRTGTTVTYDVWEGNFYAWTQSINTMDVQFTYFYPMLSAGSGLAMYKVSGIFSNYEFTIS